MTPKVLRLGTRRSALARAQAMWVREALRERFPTIDIELLAMETSGDKLLDAPLAKVGGKGLFIKELEEGLLAKTIDLAVHSLKDVPIELPGGLHLGAICEREDPRDALISPEYRCLDKLPPGARVGTSSLRRQAQLKALRPDLAIVPVRGNVQTRLDKIERDHLDAVVLAMAGLKRLGLESRVTEVLDPSISVPAVGQGALAIECRVDDQSTAEIVAALQHAESALAATAERGFLERLGGGCQVPLGAYAEIKGARIALRAFVGDPDGTRAITGRREGPAGEAESLGRLLAEDLIGKGAREILAAIGVGVSGTTY